LKDEKGQEAGNHWWLALLINPPGGAKREPTAVMVLDSMQRREKLYDPPLQNFMNDNRKYPVKITKVEQAGYLVIISFTANSDGSCGPLQRPEASKLIVDGLELRNPELGLKVNMGGTQGVSGCFEGTITFALDGRVRSSSFQLLYGESGYGSIMLEFDPFVLTKMQKNVSRFLGGYCAKEWESHGPDKTVKFEKQSARALVADVYQQENLNDCGVFVLENTLRSLSMQGDFLKKMASASPMVLKSFPWPSQQEITTRKVKLKACVAALFAAAADKGSSDVDLLLKDNAQLRADVLASLTDAKEREDQMALWNRSLSKELAARQQDKDAQEAETKKKEEMVQARRLEERLKKEEAIQKKEEDRRAGLHKMVRKVKRKHESLTPSRSPSRVRRKKRRHPSSDDDDEDESESDDRGRRKRPLPKEKERKKKPVSRSRRDRSDSEEDESREPSPPPQKSRRRR